MKFKLPELGENIEFAQVVSILVSEGDRVGKDDPVLEIETEKATLEVPAPVAGTIESLSVSEGDTLEIGQAIGEIAEEENSKTDDEDESPDDEDKSGESPKEADSEKAKKDGDKEVTPSDEDESEDEDDDSESEDEDFAEADRDASTDDENEHGGSEQPGEDAQTADPDQPVEPAPVTGSVPVFAAPTVRGFAREIGIDIGKVAGSGKGGGISIEDIKRHARMSRAAGYGASTGSIATAPLPDFSRWGEIEREDLTGIQSKTSERMSASWSTVPHVTLFEKADCSELEAGRQRFKERIEKETGAKLTITALLLKIVAAALGTFPEVAASFDGKSKQRILKRYCHIGVAVDTPNGLLVPVIRDVDRKNVSTLAEELENAAARARDGKLSGDDMSGGVFTLTNLGGLGTAYFTPIINQPEGAILGVGLATTEAVYDEAEQTFCPCPMLPLSLSFDHRLIDGAAGARFLHWIVEAIKDPLLVAMEG